MGGVLQSRLWVPASQTLWTPLDISSGRGGYYNVTDGATVTLDTGRVQNLADQYGVFGDMPDYAATGGPSSTPVMTFNGGQALFNTAISIASGTLITAFVVGSRSLVGTNDYCRFVSFAPSTGSDFSDGYIALCQYSTNAAVEAYCNGDLSSAAMTIGSSFAGVSTVTGTLGSSSSQTTWVNATSGTPSSGTINVFTATRLGIGARASFAGSNPLSTDSLMGGISAIVLLTGTVTSDTIQRLMGWGAWHFGFQADLAGGSTYASAPPYV